MVLMNTSLSVNLKQCRRCIPTNVSRRKRTYSNESSTSSIEEQKMQAKNVVLNQWKIVNNLKSYFSNSSAIKIFENTVNKEVAQLLQKIQPSVYGKRFLDTTVSVDKTATGEQNAESKLSSMLNGLLSKKTVKTDNITAVPKWKVKKCNISKESVALYTAKIVSQILQAKSTEYSLQKIDDLCCHLKQYPGAKHNAVKEGAVRWLLKIRQKAKNDITLICSINEALALLGHSYPVCGNGIRILSIDGGGVRGILVIQMLKKLEELTGKPTHENFDLICGVSTGAIIANLVGVKQKSLDEISKIYRDLSIKIFNQSPIKGTSNLVWSHSYYDTALWEKLLKVEMGDETLIKTRRSRNCPKLCTVSTVVNQSRLSAYLFRNYTFPVRVQSQYAGSFNHLVWEAVRASAAAPTYFEEFKLGNLLHQDGGILVNNPTAVAIHEAKLLWPTTSVQSVISFGTGRTAPNHIDVNAEPISVNNSSWKSKFFTILESATDTEGVHTMLSDLLPDNVYYRFNPYLTEMLDIAEINPKKLEQLERDTVMYLRRNEDKFHEAANSLSTSKTIKQKLLDWIHLQKEIQGFNVA